MRERGRQHQMKHWCFCRVEAVHSPRDNIAILPDQEFSLEVLQVNNLPINKSRTEGLVFDMRGGLNRLIRKMQKWQVRVKGAHLLATKAVSLSLSVPSTSSPASSTKHCPCSVLTVSTLQVRKPPHIWTLGCFWA